MTTYINEFAEKWLQELETTDRKQGKGYLCSDKGFCCLGVAYDMEDVDYKIENKTSPMSGTRRYKDPTNKTMEEATMVLGNRMQKELGLKYPEGSVDDEDLTIPKDLISREYHESIATANDSGDYNFKEMAAIIRHNAHLLFVPVEEG